MVLICFKNLKNSQKKRAKCPQTKTHRYFRVVVLLRVGNKQ